MLKVLCIAIDGGRASLFALVPILAQILNGQIFS